MSTTSSAHMESKSAKKRKAKAEAAATAAPTADTSVEAATNGHAEADSGEHPYLRELAKQLRNANKKLTNIHKTETVVAEHGGKSLDELLAMKKINADQKAQLEKKPQLQQQIQQLEEQQKHFSGFASDLEARSEKEKADLVEAHEAEIQKTKDDAADTSSKELPGKIRGALQVVSHFLHAAAAKRQAEDVDSEEARAYEGVLFHLYQGNAAALNTMVNLVEGSQDKVQESSGEELDYTFSQLKVSALKDAEGAEQTGAEEDEEPQEPVEAPADETHAPQSDPTVTNAGLTELDDVQRPQQAVEATEATAAPEQTAVGDDAANASAESKWDPQASAITDTTQSGEDWVQVPRDPSETENHHSPAAAQSTSNWADETAAASDEKSLPPPYSENDGFSEVRRERGGRGRGGPRGGRGFEGRGGRGGRGRGEHRGRGGRGPRGGHRGAPATPTNTAP